MDLLSTPITTATGEDTTLGALLDGRAALLVNVASKCGLTPQYTALKELHDAHAADGFTVVGLPCNQFHGQEPGTEAEILEFCSSTYGIDFPLTAKLEVNGEGRHPLFAQLTEVPDAEGAAGDVQWNFEKFVVSADGARVTRFRPLVDPLDPAVVAAVRAATNG